MQLKAISVLGGAGFVGSAIVAKLMSRDNVYLMQVDSVSAPPFPAIFELMPAALEVIMPESLLNQTPCGAYGRFRSSAVRK